MTSDPDFAPGNAWTSLLRGIIQFIMTTTSDCGRSLLTNSTDGEKQPGEQTVFLLQG